MNKKNKFLIQELVDYYSKVNYSDLPKIVIEKARMKLLDLLSVYIVGYHKGFLTQQAIKYIAGRTSKKESSVLIAGIKTNLELSTFVTSLISHSLELDDGHRYGTAHPAAVIIPSVLAFSEYHEESLEKMLTAITISYDIMLRLSRSINPSHLIRGFHTTSTTGTIGSAIAASCIMDYGSEKMMHAVALAGLFSSGLQEMLHSNPSSKALQVGHAAQSGASAAIFAGLGVKGPLSLLEGQHGWLKAMTNSFDKNSLLGDLGSRWEIMYTYTKLYPTCRHCHPAIDLAIEAYNKGYRINNIKRLRLITYSVAISEVGIIKKPSNAEEAMFSVSYAVAVALCKGRLKIEDLEYFLNNKKVISFIATIDIERDNEMDKKYPDERGCILEITSFNGEKKVLSTNLPKGEHDNELTTHEYYAKFKNISSAYVYNNFIDDLGHLIFNSENNHNIMRIIPDFFELKPIE